MSRNPHHDSAAAYFENCLLQCGEWFGPIPDREWPLVTRDGPDTRIWRSIPDHVYYLQLAPLTVDRIGYAEDLAHLAVKQVCLNRRDALKTRWLFEVIATIAVRMLLHGNTALEFTELSEARILSHFAHQERMLSQWHGIVNPSQIIEWKWPLMFWYRDPPAEYAAAIELIAQDLERIVGWNRLASAASFRSYSKWKESLPAPMGDIVDRTVRPH